MKKATDLQRPPAPTPKQLIPKISGQGGDKGTPLLIGSAGEAKDVDAARRQSF
jgi:hypothetical protein